MPKTVKLHGHDYVVINPSAERAQQIMRAFERSNDVTLDDAYGRYSHAKRNAYEYCVAREREFGSFNGVITGHNTCTFSYAFTGLDESGKRWLIYITVAHDYAIPYEY